MSPRLSTTFAGGILVLRPETRGGGVPYSNARDTHSRRPADAEYGHSALGYRTLLAVPIATGGRRAWGHRDIGARA